MEQREKLKDAFSKDGDKIFKERYEACKDICVDPKFEKFYQELMDDMINDKTTLCH